MQSDAQSIRARLQSLPIEYEKVLAGDPQYANGGGPADSLVIISTDTAALAKRAEWLSDEQRTAVVGAVERGPEGRPPRSRRPTTSQSTITEATTAVEQTFGLASTSGTTSTSTGSGS